MLRHFTDISESSDVVSAVLIRLARHIDDSDFGRVGDLVAEFFLLDQGVKIGDSQYLIRVGAHEDHGIIHLENSMH